MVELAATFDFAAGMHMRFAVDALPSPASVGAIGNQGFAYSWAELGIGRSCSADLAVADTGGRSSAECPVVGAKSQSVVLAVRHPQWVPAASERPETVHVRSPQTLGLILRARQAHEAFAICRQGI